MSLTIELKKQAPTGTGTVTLDGASQDFQGFVGGIGASNSTYYCIQNTGQDEFEVGTGVVNAGITLTITVVSQSRSRC